MENREAIEKLERQLKAICLDCKHRSVIGWCENHCRLPEAFNMAISALEKQEADRWIPVTERLPEVGQSVVITVAGIYTTEGCLKDDGNWCQFRWSAEHKPAIVGAWKPLPEPYKAEEEA